MLIVIVIIGILAAALIPRLSSARGRANDVARKADLAQVAAAIVMYQIDHAKFIPCATWCTLSSISTLLTSAWMSTIPRDPDASRLFSWIANSAAWEFSYITIRKWSLDNNGFVLMAGAETEGWANWVYTWDILNTTNFEDITPCVSFTQSSSNSNINWVCTYKKLEDVLRYVYIY